MKTCILCSADLTEEEIDLGFDVCEVCEAEEDFHGGFDDEPRVTKMRIRRDTPQKRAHRPRGLDKFDAVDTRDFDGED